jgi:hypothetical protein
MEGEEEQRKVEKIKKNTNWNQGKGSTDKSWRKKKRSLEEKEGRGIVKRVP